jgi:hypothetical protein
MGHPSGVIDSYLENKKTTPVVRGYDLLSEREQQVFRLMVEGKILLFLNGFFYSFIDQIAAVLYRNLDGIQGDKY